MSENEAIKVLEKPSKHIRMVHKTKNEMEFYTFSSDLVEAFEKAIQALEEIQQYRAIGTIEEFKALKEKNTPYKPNEYEDRYYACKCDNILLPKWKKYPTILMPKSEGLPHCMACGQKLDWSE